MKNLALIPLFWILLGGQLTVGAPLEMITNSGPESVFGGGAKEISIIFHNPNDQDFSTDMRLRLWQTSSATAIRLADAPWKTLQVLPRQTVLESAQLDFPLVRARTKFLVQWYANTNQILGTTPVLVYPTNLLTELSALMNPGDALEPGLGVLDPHHQLVPALKNAGVKFVDLEDTGLDGFSGRLAVIGPFPLTDPESDGLTERVSRLNRRGAAVVWIQAPPPSEPNLQPSFYLVPKAATAAVVVNPELVASLADNPQSQLNLIYFCRLALQPEPFQLPKLTNQP